MIDTVHDIGYAYRQLLKSFSFPGTVNRILHEDIKTEFPCKMDPAAIILGMILLDGEVEAYFSGYDDDSLSYLQHLTYLNFGNAEVADFLFFNSDGESEQNRIKLLSSAKTGTLTDPHIGATAVLAVKGEFKEARSADVFSSSYISLSGPGIEKEKQRIIPLEDAWWSEARNTLCREFPLGIDVILYDEKLQVLAIPRSMKLSWYSQNKE
jgi:alpha-D-ribose 1-methylphosphonate 5-triphosphate synthase subunit PhnH